MKHVDSVIGSNWHVIESGERWYQAVLRFTGSEAAERTGMIRRWDPGSLAGLIAWAGQDPTQRAILLWEVPAEPQRFLLSLDAMATIRRSHPRAVQLAYLPATAWSSRALVVQEAGASLLLNELWTLEKIVNRLMS